MKALYLELKMGAAGDMLTGALMDLLDPEERQTALNMLNSAGIPGVTYVPERGSKCGIPGIHMHVMVNGEEEIPQPGPGDEAELHSHGHTHDHEHNHGHEHTHSHTSPADVEKIISETNLPDEVKEAGLGVYRLIADAESYVHGTDLSELHFHEVGMMDAIADVLAVCYLMHIISPERIAASPVNVGGGTVKCAHGILPVPVPATLKLLEGIPMYSGSVKSELCTPTGAALVRYFADEYGGIPLMTTERTGCGLGTKDFDEANIVRVMLGESVSNM